jgi:DNA polymerase-3 subunit delta
MTPEQAIAASRTGEIAPVYLVLGEERLLSTRVVSALREAVIGGVDLGLNEDHLVAGEADVEQVLNAAKTLPMMAARRLVIVRSVERWEPKSDGKGRGTDSPLDRLAEYAAAPADSTTLVLVAQKLDSRRKLVTHAKKTGYLVACDSPTRQNLPSWVDRAAKERGKRLAPGVAELLAELLGPELSPIDDALERLSLYVGDASEITEETVGECVVQLKPSTVWELVGALGRRDVGAALGSLARVYDPQDRGLRLLGVLGWSTRQLLRFSQATAEGLPAAEAAKRAGAPPFKANDLARQVKHLSPGELERWLVTLADVDLALKGGSKRAPQAVLEEALISLCRTPTPRSQARRS